MTNILLDMLYATQFSIKQGNYSSQPNLSILYKKHLFLASFEPWHSRTQKIGSLPIYIYQIMIK